jgi:uncharacterized membrane protein (DUF4010 family)
MEQQELIDGFVMFGSAGLLGFLIGLERSMGESNNPHATIRDFVIFAFIGATSAFAGSRLDNPWLIIGGLLAVLALLVSGYWAGHRDKDAADSGITTEGAGIVTFFLGVLVVVGAPEFAIAVAIALLFILSEKDLIERFGTQIRDFEIQATVKFLVITFIVLPILPTQSLDDFVTVPIGTVTEVDRPAAAVQLVPGPDQSFATGESLQVYLETAGKIGGFQITEVSADLVSMRFEGAGKGFSVIERGVELRAPLVPDLISTMLSAIQPFKVWLIVVLVSFIGFIGYVLIKVVGAGAGIGLTGLVGGLASSTVTTMSFSGRSKDLPQLNRAFAVGVILASSVMFPRVLLQIGVFNKALMANIALPMLVTGGVGLLMAVYLQWRSHAAEAASEEISFDNPFSLKSAITFGLVFTTILVATRVATAYLGDAWLPIVAIVSGLTDADAIAFSVSDLERAGLISLDWASFNLVLGSLSNTYMKLFLVFSLGHRGLFKQCLVPFLLMGAAGVATMFLYYDVPL